jgi:hypothetical protein
MYTDMEEWTEIRLRVLNEEASKREILREKGMHWKTLQKILSYSEPPGYRMVYVVRRNGNFEATN